MQSIHVGIRVPSPVSILFQAGNKKRGKKETIILM
jgi:hypothetical protein